MKYTIRKTIFATILSLSMSLQFVSPILADEEETEEIQEIEGIMENVEEENTEEEIVVEEESYNGFEYTQYAGGAVITKYTGTSNHLNIPNTIGNLPVKFILGRAFYKSTAEYVTIPENVQEIGVEAFAFMTHLKQVTFKAKECQDMPDWEYPFLESGVSTGYELVIDGNCQVI
ncbi:MAG: hypothetical protein KBT48_09655, partial [Firmicutes bacterium]|nr:hypothetical protein [Bacillota bacterium]